MDPAALSPDIEKIVEEKKGETFNAEGTYYQSLVEPRHGFAFFAPLPKRYAEAVHKDAETVQYTEEEEASMFFSVASWSNHRNHAAGRQEED